MITNLSKIDEHCNNTKCEECKVWDGDGCRFYKALGIAFSLFSREEKKTKAIIKGYCKDCKFFMNNFVKEELDATDYEDVVCTYHMADGFTSYGYCSMFEQKGEEQ